MNDISGMTDIYVKWQKIFTLAQLKSQMPFSSSIIPPLGVNIRPPMPGFGLAFRLAISHSFFAFEQHQMQ